eukprot:CAMPEP_0177654674 /NCGR_PEP_ID=MMETSP0447-20121125/14474_1 /TAXON_ID=0 /ORGANISM="Stygamoeba regulata, Strain BSH-02190019" /LENGTH=351 /DNA_ID=CAMNT_0019158371 /DNA_START=27 /DNA_END=1082 /DNA_ORIENTATION=-
MGNDGGSVPTRGELVKRRKVTRPQNSRMQEARLRLTACALSKEPLIASQVVCDFLGNLFNKEALVAALLARTLPARFAHIRRLRDVFAVHFTPADASSVVSKSSLAVAVPTSAGGSEELTGVGGLQDDHTTRFICPISRVQVSGLQRFVVLSTCGCVVAERVIREIPTRKCLVCEKPFDENDVILLNADETETAELVKRLVERRSREAAAKKLKKQKRSQKRVAIAASTSSSSSSSLPLSSSSSSSSTSSPSTSTSMASSSVSSSRSRSSSSKSSSKVSRKAEHQRSSDSHAKKRVRGLTTAELAEQRAANQLKNGSKAFRSMFKSSVVEIEHLQQGTGSQTIRNFCGTGV